MISLLGQWAAQRSDSLALSYGDTHWSWAQLSEEVERYQGALAGAGLEPGDVLGAAGRNSPELLLTYLACVNAGVIFAPLAPAPDAVLAGKLATAGAKCVFGTDAIAGVSVFLPDGKQASPCHAYQPEALTTLIFTSGSTGQPKAAAHTCNQHLASARGLIQCLHYKPWHSWLLSLPLYHVSGMAIVWRWLSVGATLVMPTGDLLADLNSVTHASLVPTQLQRALDSGQELRLERVLLGGSYIPVALCEQAKAAGMDVWLGYGMTEAASTVTAKQADGKEGAGHLLPGRKLKIEDGRIYIGGNTLASGYWNKGKLTPITAKDSWYDSKDLGEWLQGELKVLGRADNQFISGGENIHCEEIEAVLLKHPRVTQAYVVPVEDKEFGHRPVAFVVREESVSDTDLEQFFVERCERFKRPVAYYPLPELSGQGIKVSRAELKAWLEKQGKTG